MGYRHRGFFFFPPFAFFFGLFVLFMLFKTGLWIPLLIGGLIFWAMRHHRFEGGCGGWEKRKHMPMRYEWYDDDDIPQKPKRDEYI